VGKAEAGPNPGRGGRDLREKKSDSNWVACCKDKKRGVPPKTRWKEEQREKARDLESPGKENRAAAVPGPGEIIATTGSERSEAQQSPGEAQEGAVAVPGPEEVAIAEGPEGGKMRQASVGAPGGTKEEEASTPVACVTGVPREPASGRELACVARPGSRTPPETLEQINQQYLKSKYKFKEGAPLKEYLQQRIPSFRDVCTLTEVLTWLKEIIRDNLLFEERNPAMIVGDAPLEAALRKKRVHVNDIRSVVIQQLTMVEARQGPWSAAMLAGGMTRLGRMPVNPRPAVRAVAAPTSMTGVRVVSLTEMPAPANPRPAVQAVTAPASTPGVSVVSSTEGPAGPVVLYSPVPGIPQDIGTVSYTPPPAARGGAECGRGSSGSHASRGELHGSAGAFIDPSTRNLQGPPSQ
jgi:hypothetical protein